MIGHSPVGRQGGTTLHINDGFIPMSDADAWAFVVGGTVGRLGLSMGAMPVILPVHYTVVEHTILVPADAESSIAAAAAGTVVAFAVDDYERPNTLSRNVLALGQSQVVVDSTGATLVRITPQFVSGWSYRT